MSSDRQDALLTDARRRQGREVRKQKKTSAQTDAKRKKFSDVAMVQQTLFELDQGGAR